MSWLLVLVGTLAGLIGAGSMAAKSARLEKALAAASADAARGHAAQAALFSEITRELRGLVLRLGLFSSGRASLFHCRGDHFVLVGRFSPSPRYQRSSGRITHPINAGVIGVAWHKGSAERHLPSPGPNEQEPSPRWLEAQDRLGVPAEIARALTMKSSAYAARRINDENGRPLGVLVIESDRDAIGHRQTSSVTQPRVSLELLETAGDAEFAARMVRLLGTIAPLPNADVRRCVEDLLRQW
ncbi:MAG: hypothetical protein QOE09_1361 [Ilumatobacteraceae bacterium]